MLVTFMFLEQILGIHNTRTRGLFWSTVSRESVHGGLAPRQTWHGKRPGEGSREEHRAERVRVNLNNQVRAQ